VSEIDAAFVHLAVQRGMVTPQLAQACQGEAARTGQPLPKLLLERGGLDPALARALYEEARYSQAPPQTQPGYQSGSHPAAPAAGGFVSPVTSPVSTHGGSTSGFGSMPGSHHGSGRHPLPGQSSGQYLAPTLGQASGSHQTTRPGQLEVGAIFARRYRLDQELGRGAMGIVWKAQQLDLDRPVALKMLLQGSMAGDSLRRRFVDEARSVARLDHPNVVKVHDVGEEDGILFFTMDYISGPTLRQKIKQSKIPIDQILEIGSGIAEGLQHAHEGKLVHRDLKPANILIDSSGRPRITDFGIAKDTSRTEGGMTREGEVLGTPAYMSPEQADGGAHSSDARTDIYALGAILYRALTGVPPYQGDSGYDILTKVLTAPVPNAQDENAEIPDDLNELITQLLAKEVGDRPATAEEAGQRLRKILRRYQRGSSLAPQAIPRQSSPKGALLLGVGVLVLGLGVTGGIFGWRAYQNAQRIAAEQAAEEAARKQAAEEAAAREAALEALAEARGLKSQEDALAKLETCFPALSDHAPAFVAKGEALLALDRVDDAVDAFQAAQALTPKDLPTRVLLGKAILARGDLQAAEEIAEVLEELPAGRRAGAELRSAIAEESGEIGTAADHLGRASQAAPKDGELKLRYAELLKRARRFVSSEEVATQAIALLPPQDARGHTLRAQVRFELGEFRKSGDDAQEALRRDPRDQAAQAVARSVKRRLAAQPRRTPKPITRPPGTKPGPNARLNMRQPPAGTKPHDDDHAALKACLQALQRRDRRAAVEAIKAQLQEKPLRCKKALITRHRCFMGLGDIPHALHDLTTYLKLAGPTPEGVQSVLHFARGSKTAPEAIQLIRSLSSFARPRDPSWRVIEGQVLSQHGQGKAALAAFGQALQTDPTFFEANHERSHLYLRLFNQPDKALADAEVCLQAAPNRLHFLVLGADAADAAGKRERAIALYEQAAASKRGNPREREHARAQLAKLKK
jgi:tetratricopeptide (TPR) repeat protein